MTDTPQDDYDRGWQAHRKFAEEWREVERLGRPGPGPLAWAVGLYTVGFAAAFVVPLVRWGDYHGGFLLAVIGGVVWTAYLIRAQRRADEEYRVAQRRFAERWNPHFPPRPKAPIEAD